MRLFAVVQLGNYEAERPAHCFGVFTDQARADRLAKRLCDHEYKVLKSDSSWAYSPIMVFPVQQDTFIPKPTAEPDHYDENPITEEVDQG